MRHVITTTTKPSWVQSVPHNFGAAAAGTPKADEWRTLYTIYLPIVLVLAWGRAGTASPSDAKALADLLDHTMSLVCAFLMACKRTLTKDRALSYRKHITSYVGGLTTLRPDLEHNSIHHMAFHIYDFLLLFGPVYSWWCFPFERLIGLLQRIPQNHRFGESPEANLRCAYGTDHENRHPRSYYPPRIRRWFQSSALAFQTELLGRDPGL